MYSSTTLPPIRVPYIIIGIGMEGGRGGRGVLDYLPDCSEDHSACGGGKGFGHKNGHMAGGMGDWYSGVYFFIHIFHILSLVPSTMVVREAFFLAF